MTLMETFFVALFLGTMIYTAYVVRQEARQKENFHVHMLFQKGQLIFPKWWNIYKEGTKFIQVQGLDASIYFIKTNVSFSNNQIFHQIERFFQINWDIDADMSSKSLGPNHYYKKEGLCTIKHQERKYLSLNLWNSSDSKKSFIAIQVSPVLHGIQDGPYFEKTIVQISNNLKHFIG